MLSRDLTFALRSLRRSPGFTLVSVLTLALGIGATTAIFSVVDALLLEPLPFREPDRLVTLGRVANGEAGLTQSFPNYVDYRARSRSFDALAAWEFAPFTLTGPEGVPARLDGVAISHDLLPLLGVEPVLGRGISSAEDRRGGDAVALMSYRLWKGRFGGDSSVLGQSVHLDGALYTVIGVLPPGGAFLPFLAHTDVLVPLRRRPGADVRGRHNLHVVGRLAPGVSLASAQADVLVVSEQLAEEHPDPNADIRARLEPYRRTLVSPVSTQLWLLLGAVGFVLAIACANIANLELNRTASRAREVCTRRALGAGFLRLLRQFLIEGAVLAAAGGLLGLFLAFGGLRMLLEMAPQTLPLSSQITIDARVLLFSLSVTALTGLVFGLTPLVEVGRVSLAAALREGGQGSASRSRQLLRRSLVVAEVALAVVLVAGAGLLLRTLWRLGEVDPGFAHANVLAVKVSRPMLFIMPEWRQNVDFFAHVAERLAALPSVEASSAAYQAPYDRGWATSFILEGHPEPEPGQDPTASFRPTLPGYFQTVGIPLVQGRPLDERDHSDAAGAAVVNQAFVEAYLEARSPLGERLRFGSWWKGTPERYEIVGVVGDVRFAGLDQPAQPVMYFPHAQVPVPELTFLLRTGGDPRALADPVRREIRALDPALPLDHVTTLGEGLLAYQGQRRFMLRLLGLFAVTAVGLAALGIYGVLACGVTERRRELGLRLALGARPGQVHRLVLRQGLAMTALGLMVGALGASALTRFLSSMLFGVSAQDPTTFATVAAFLGIVAMAASWIPADRATRIEPMVVLRHD